MVEEYIKECRKFISSHDFPRAMNYLLELEGSKERVKTFKEAQDGLLAFVISLVLSRRFSDAAHILWDQNQFTTGPHSVDVIWNALTDPGESKVLVVSGGSLGKTYSSAAWIILNWIIDPEYTCIKVVSSTSGHAKSGIMAKILSFHRNSAIPLPGRPEGGGLLYGDSKDSSITPVAIPAGDSGEGRLAGIHPVPRKTEHPVLGKLSRVIALLDEADTVKTPVWGSLDNMLASRDYKGSVKVVCLSNPRNKSNPFAHRAEPRQGWSWVYEHEDVETWISKYGWTVIRLDGARSENVREKRIVYPGLLTYEGYSDLEAKGDHDAEYWIYARGLYPKEGLQSYNVFTLSSFDQSRGIFVFDSVPVPIASIDPAFAEGGDRCVLTLAEYGNAIAYKTEAGEIVNLPKIIQGIQVKQQFDLVKGKTHEMGERIIAMLREYNVSPSNVVIDRTGNGRGLFDHLTWRYGTVLGIGWGEAATDLKVLDQDTLKASERFKGMAAELWFACSEWLDKGYIKFSPSLVGFQELRDAMLLRKWKFSSTYQTLESKEDFKRENRGKPLDPADSFVQLPHILRIREAQRLGTGPGVKLEGMRRGGLWDNAPDPDKEVSWIDIDN